MLRQIEWWVQNGLIPKKGDFLENIVSVGEPLIKSWFDVPTTQMPIFVFFVSARVLFGGAFFPLSIFKLSHGHFSAIITKFSEQLSL